MQLLLRPDRPKHMLVVVKQLLQCCCELSMQLINLLLSRVLNLLDCKQRSNLVSNPQLQLRATHHYNQIETETSGASSAAVMHDDLFPP